jgi:hypothetical protein
VKLVSRLLIPYTTAVSGLHFSVDCVKMTPAMFERFRRNNRMPLWSRLVSCAALGLYLFALVILPAMHGHSCEHAADTCCGHSESAPQHVPDADDCPICEFALLAVPYFTVAEPLLWQAESVSDVSFVVSIPSVADVTALPPCRAPPVI